MTSISALRQRVARLREQVEQMRPPSTRLFVVENGGDLSDEQLAQVRPGDCIIVSYVPTGYLRADDDDNR